ncbi:hypothetical protein [Altererythrobacter sp. GH1-8]|uniref:hypothetical protein n=1 Tax=Altererythrobacter sp. GH1-8 TaxID=3349333 RepID=UPI00374CB16C
MTELVRISLSDPHASVERVSDLQEAPAFAGAHGGNSDTHKPRFLERLSLTGNVRSACRAVAITPMTAYRWRRSCPHFARGWEAALVVARAAAEEVLADRALNGVEEKVFYHGEEVATRVRYDTRLLLAHLARLDAKAADRNLAEAAADFDAVLAHFEKTGEMPAAAMAARSPEPALARQGARRGAAAPPREEEPSLEELYEQLERARPAGAPAPEDLAEDHYPAEEVRADQLLAFLDGVDDWWLIGPPPEWDEDC